MHRTVADAPLEICNFLYALHTRSVERHTLSLAEVHDHGAGQRDVVGQNARGGRGAGQGDVDSTGQVGRESTARGGREGREGGAAGRGGVGEAAEGGARGGVALEVQHGSLRESADASYRSRAGHRQGGEGGEDQVGTAGARRDEGGGQGEDSLRAERRVEGRRRGGDTRGDADERLVSGLDGENGSGGAEDRRVRNKRRSTKVGRNTNALENGCGSNHAGGISEAEVVLAGLDRLDTSLCDGALEQANVGLLARANALEVGKLNIVQAKSLELVVTELGETLLVERSLEPFQGQSAIILLVICLSKWGRSGTYNCRISTSARPRAAAAAF